jgi:hypothetical protein
MCFRPDEQPEEEAKSDDAQEVPVKSEEEQPMLALAKTADSAIATGGVLTLL